MAKLGGKKSQNHLVTSMKLLRREALELYLPKTVPEIDRFPEPFEFYRKYVAPSIPVVIKHGVRNWVAIKNWNKEYLIKKMRDKKLTVAVTPNGYADAVGTVMIHSKKKEVFILPEEKEMTMAEFFHELEEASGGKHHRGVFYLQKQNSNLTEEFPELLPDIDGDFPWATEVFQAKPTAINLWIGDQKAITSLHKDPFENLYCVISGHKDFTLFSPTDRPWLPYETLPVAKYKETSPGKYEAILVDKLPQSTDSLDHEHSSALRTPWINIDPLDPNHSKYPLYQYATPITVRVEAGDLLYLPCNWFHHVQQSHMCMAVNYWFDMTFDIKYAYFQMLDSLSYTLHEHHHHHL